MKKTYLFRTAIVTMFVILVAFSIKNISESKDADISNRISKHDLAVHYNGLKINYDTAFSDITDKFGYGNDKEYEGNNYGYMVGCPDARRFVIKYPNYEETVISLICIENYVTGNIFIERIRLDLMETERGIKKGDSKAALIDAYGEDYQMEKIQQNVYYYTYTDNLGHCISFAVDEDLEEIIDILIEYNTDSVENMMIENYQNELFN